MSVLKSGRGDFFLLRLAWSLGSRALALGMMAIRPLNGVYCRRRQVLRALGAVW